jgi:threonine/homoserine/homoserine lactone efflux protein
MLDHLSPFLAVSAAVIVTPGQDTALTIRNTLLGGRRSGQFTAIGVAAGQTIWTVAVTGGLTAVLLASERAFHAIKLLGAAYLAFLGAQALYGALRVGSAGSEVSPAPSHHLPPRVALRQGLISNLTNPKMATFFPALLPQFAPEGVATFLVLFVLGLTFALMTVAWLTGYAYAVSKAGDFLRRPQIRRLVEAATGTALVALGLHLAVWRR